MSKSIRTLDEVFSRYIRRRDCPNGIGRCISCGALISYDTCDAGHYIGRAHTATRWNETNVHAQCRICNRHKYGNLKAYRRRLETNKQAFLDVLGIDMNEATYEQTSTSSGPEE